MSLENEIRPIYLRLGETWASASPWLEHDFTVMPRRGEAIELLVGMDQPRTLRVLDVKHSIVDDLSMTELLVFPEE